MFYGASILNSPLNGWDVSSVTSMHGERMAVESERQKHSLALPPRA